MKSKFFKNNTKGSELNSTAVEIYSQAQIPRQRRGASILKSSSKSKHNNESLSKLKQEMKDTSLYFYEGLKNKYNKPKPKEQASASMGLIDI